MALAGSGPSCPRWLPGVNMRGWGVVGGCLARLSSVLLHPQRELPPPAPPAGITRSKSKHELKLLEKIPENAEATVVLVGMWAGFAAVGGGWRRPGLPRCPPGAGGRPAPSLSPWWRPTPRLRGVPVPPHHGLRAATRGGGAGRGPGGARARALPLPASGPEQCQHGLPRDRPLHLHPHV